jgi:hypothetical protein
MGLVWDLPALALDGMVLALITSIGNVGTRPRPRHISDLRGLVLDMAALSLAIVMVLVGLVVVLLV